LRPWTIPNAIGFLRLALIPVFLAIALSTRDGVDALSATLYAVIGWGDYADGLAARITRQYSRLGTLMDPVSDRLLVICGVIVCWRFELLPRWALAVLIARELVMLLAGRYAVKRGVEIQINWPGRLSVAPIMGALFFAMTGLRTFPEALLYLGIAMAIFASGLYFSYGLAQLRASGGAQRS
jgi:cardiolipin synthase